MVRIADHRIVAQYGHVHSLWNKARLNIAGHVAGVLAFQPLVRGSTPSPMLNCGGQHDSFRLSQIYANLIIYFLHGIFLGVCSLS